MSRLTGTIHLLAATLLAQVLTAPAQAAGPEPRTASEQEVADAGLARVEASIATATGQARQALMLEAGERRRLRGDVEGARRWFETLVTEAGGAPAGLAAKLGLALIEADTGQLDDAQVSVFVGVPERHALRSQNAERLAWLAVWSTRQGQDGRAQARKALELADGDVLRTRLQARLAAAGLSPVLERQPLSVVADLGSSRDALAAGDRELARRRLATTRSHITTVEQAAQADRLQRAVDGAPVSPDRLGVLLPLSGRFGAVGEQVQEALAFGWEAAGAPGQLVVVDSGGTAATAVAAFDRLVEEEGVIAVLGPLLSDEADAVADAADTVGVPLVALTQGLTDAAAHPWAFQGWLTLEDQVAALLDHTMGHLGHARYVVLAPDTAYGRTASEAFVADVVGRGGEIVLHESYAADATDFRPVAQKVARRPSSTEPPVVDYDAIFIPDHARRVALVAAGLAFEEVPVGTFAPHDDPAVPLLGLSGWNSHELIAGGGSYTQRGFFTDVFVPPPDNAHTWYAPEPWRAFVDAYKRSTGRTPSPVEALASDVARVMAAARAAQPDTRTAFREAMTSVDASTPATGAGGFDPTTGVLSHRIRVLSVQKDGFAPVPED